jgi:hypothetical protein
MYPIHRTISMDSTPVLPPCGCAAENKSLRELKHLVAMLEEQDRRERERREKEKKS